MTRSPPHTLCIRPMPSTILPHCLHRLHLSRSISHSLHVSPPLYFRACDYLLSAGIWHWHFGNTCLTASTCFASFIFHSLSIFCMSDTHPYHTTTHLPASRGQGQCHGHHTALLGGHAAVCRGEHAAVCAVAGAGVCARRDKQYERANHFACFITQTSVSVFFVRVQGSR